MHTSVLLRSHLLTLWIILTIGLLTTTYDHSDYRFPWLAWYGEHPQFHDFHHESFVHNFGVLGLLDRLHGTYGESGKTKIRAESEIYKTGG